MDARDKRGHDGRERWLKATQRYRTTEDIGDQRNGRRQGALVIGCDSQAESWQALSQRRRSTGMRHIFSIVCIGLIIWLASDKIAATYPRENWVAVLTKPTKCNTREEMDKVVALMMQRENGTSSSFWSSCQELPSGTEVFVELVPYFNLCIRASDEVSCMWSDEGWNMRIVK